jgi:hypothetical protein
MALDQAFEQRRAPSPGFALLSRDRGVIPLF